MAKDKPPKTKGIANKHLHARTTFLYQAATYLTLHAGQTSKTVASDTAKTKVSQPDEIAADGRSNLALQLGAHLHTVSRKGQVRLSADIKRTICKSCNTVLIPGRTSKHVIENDSKGGKKQWADILVVECVLCGNKKRFPIGARRQKRKAQRNVQKPQDSVKKNIQNLGQSTTPAGNNSAGRSPASG